MTVCDCEWELPPQQCTVDVVENTNRMGYSRSSAIVGKEERDGQRKTDLLAGPSAREND
jgi:hypothetical protein